MISTSFSIENAISLLHGDSLNELNSIPDDSVDLIITSPPYNVGKEYELKTSLSEYLKLFDGLLVELKRVLSPTGSICWQVGNYVKDGEIYPLDFYYYARFKRLNFKLRNRIIWRFGHGLHASKRFSGRYETILWVTKSNDYKFNLDSVRVPSKYPGKRHYKGPKKGELAGNPLGKNPTDIWDFVENDWSQEVWDIPNVKHNHPEKTEHPCQYPVELVERCILALTNEQDLVLDPFSGVASTLIAGIRRNRRVCGIEKEESYVDISKARIQQLLNSSLRTREIGTPIFSPRK